MSAHRAVYLEEFHRSLRDGDLPRARTWLHACVELDPADPGLALRMADLLGRLGHAQVASDWMVHAAQLAEALGQRPLARHLLVRACALHPAALEPAIAHAHLSWLRGETAAAAELLEGTFRSASAAGPAPLWSWLVMAIPVARAARSLPLAIDATCGAAALIGPGLLCAHLAPGVPADASTWPLEEATLALLELEEDAPPLLALRAELADASLATSGAEHEAPFSVVIPRRNLFDPAELAAGVTPERDPAPEPQAHRRPADAQPTAARRTSTCHRAHRPRPWQIPESIEAMRLPAQPVMPRELLGRLPEPMRRAVLWLEADQRRAARAQAAAAGSR